MIIIIIVDNALSIKGAAWQDKHLDGGWILTTAGTQNVQGFAGAARDLPKG